MGSRQSPAVIELTTLSTLTTSALELPSTPISEPSQVAREDENDAENETNNVYGPDDQHLEPIDGGPAAWKLLCAAFIFEALMWGLTLSFGVFQNYYSQLPQFENDPYISVVGTIATGIVYLGAPFTSPLVKRYRKYQRHMIIVGWVICIVGLIAGSFAKTLGALIITQGVMYGTGVLIFYYPILNMLNEFWIGRRGMAFGLLCSASGFSGMVTPFAIEAMLNKYGYPTTLRAIAIALVVLTGPFIPLLKGRLPSSGHGAVGKTDWTFMKRPLFWVYSTSNIMQGMGYFFPSLYLPSYASSIGLSSAQGALLLALMALSQVIGQFTFGFLSDKRVSLDLLMTLSLVVSAVAALAIWGLARSLAPLIIFALVYGFFGAGYVAMWARMGTAVSEEPTAALATFSTFCFGKGVGNVLAGPISGNLLSQMVVVDSYGAMRYKGVVIFTGVCMALSTLSLGFQSVCSILFH